MSLFSLSNIKKKRRKKNEQDLRELWDTIKPTNVQIVEVPEGEEQERGAEKLLEETISKNSPKFLQDMNLQI